jgi:nucleoside-diphosphate-sugar epimerase
MASRIDQPKPLAVLTGATGFLGGHLAQALAAAGWRLRVLARPERIDEDLARLAPEVVAGRLGDAAALERLVEGAQAVIHGAGLIKARRPADFLAVNAAGAEAMARAAARRAPDATFVLISSLSARSPELSPYAASKAAGEAAARQALRPDRLAIVRPPAVYGPGDLETLALFRAAERLPVLPRVGAEHARFALIHAADAAAQIAALAERPAPGLWALADGRPEGYGWREVLDAAALAMGVSRPTVRLPGAVTVALGGANSALARLGAPARILSLGKARELLHPDWGVRPDEIAPGAPKARFDIAAGFADVVDWYRARGWLKASQ